MNDALDKQEEITPLEHELRVMEECCGLLAALEARQAERIIAFLHAKFVDHKDFR